MEILDPETLDIKLYAESLVNIANEGLKWERRKLEWILEGQKKAEAEKVEA
jgi:hypothetical protein